MSDVVIKESKESVLGRRVFADKNFKEGERVIKYNLKPLTPQDYQKLPTGEKKFTHQHYGKIYLYSSPERYVNHSANPNTIQDLRKKCDIAKQEIKKGEEITTDSSKDDI